MMKLDTVLLQIFDKVKKALTIVLVGAARSGLDVGESINIDEAMTASYDSATNALAIAMKAIPVEAAVEPTLEDSAVLLWWDTVNSKLYLVSEFGGTQYKVELV